VIQTGQRIGSAAGIAITGSVFYSILANTSGDFALAFRHGLIVIAAFCAAALVLALADALTTQNVSLHRLAASHGAGRRQD
jgi:hypothetical protein